MAENMGNGDGGKKLTNEQVAAQGAKELVEATKQSLDARLGETQEQRTALAEQARRVEEEAYRKLAAVHAGVAQSMVSAERAKLAGDAELKGAVRFDEDKHQTGVETNAVRALAASQGQRADAPAQAREERTPVEANEKLTGRDAAAGAAHAAQMAQVGGTVVQTAAKGVGVVDAALVARDLAEGKEVRPVDVVTAAASVTLTAGVGGAAGQAAARAGAAVGAVDAAERAANTVADQAEKPVEAKREREPARELVERIAKLSEQPQHRFEVNDPAADVTYRIATAPAATAKADELGVGRIVHREADGSAKQVDKVDGQWIVRNEQTPQQNSQHPAGAADKPLATVQEAIDREALRGIETRAELRAAAGRIEAETDRQLATADANAFRRIAERGTQESAAVEIAATARTHPEYKNGLDKAIPGYPGTAEKVYELDAANTSKMLAKEDRKGAEYEALERDKIEAAKQMTPEVAAAKAKADVSAYSEQKDQTEKYYAGRDMAVAAQYSKAYRETLEQVSPEVAKVVTEADRKAANESVGPLREAANDKSATPLPAATIDADALARVAANRARDTKQAAEELGLNGIEPAVERKQQQKLEGEEDAKRAAWIKKGEAAQPEQPKTATTRAPGDNQVASDEVFNATKNDVKPIVPVEVEQKYLRVGDKYYHPKNTEVVAFEDKGNKLETRSNSEQVAETMVTIARARGWDEIKVSGTETFRKEVWLEAAAHGMQVKGYTPSEIDKAELAKRTRDVEANKVEPDTKFRARENEAGGAKQPAAAKQNAEPEAKQPATAKPAEAARGAQDQQSDADRHKVDQLAKDRAQAFANKPPAEAVKDHPELAGTYAAMASMEKKAQADNLTPQQQAVVSARIRQNIVNSIERGELPQVQVREQTEVKRETKEEREMSR